MHKVWIDNRRTTIFLNSYVAIPVCWHKKNSFFDHSSFSCLPVFFLCVCISPYELGFVAVTNNPISVALKQQSLFLICVIVHGVLARAPLITATMRSQQVGMPRIKRFLGVLCVLEITYITSALTLWWELFKGSIQPQWSQESQSYHVFRKGTRNSCWVALSATIPC